MCDGDFDGNGLTNSVDLAILVAAIGQPLEPRFDFYQDRQINALDVEYFLHSLMGHPPGPAAVPLPPPPPPNGTAWGGSEDPDRDGDGLDSGDDLCPDLYNPGNSDVDGDHIGDACDVCLNVHWVHSLSDVIADSDGDGIGNLCDADFDNDGDATAADLGAFLACMGHPLTPSIPECYEMDANGDGLVGASDFGLYLPYFFQPTQASGLACADPMAQKPVCPPGALYVPFAYNGYY